MNSCFLDNYYLCIIHICTCIYNSLALSFYASLFIYMHHVFARTSIVEIIIYMYVPCIFLYINICNHNKFFLYSLHSSVLLHTIFLYFFIDLDSACCNAAKLVSRGSPCGIPITATDTITVTNPSHFPLRPTSLTPSSSHKTFPQSYSSH